jgi:hypothetical protein
MEAAMKPIKPNLPTMGISSGPSFKHDNVEDLNGSDKAELRKTRELVRLQRDESRAVKDHLERHDETLKHIQDAIATLTGHLRGVLNAVEALVKEVRK